MNIPSWVLIGIILGIIALAVIAVRVITRNLMDRYQKELQSKSDNIVKVASEKSRQMELEARDKALKVMQEGNLK